MTHDQAGQEWLERYTEQRNALVAANAYNPADEKDSCGVGLVAQIDGTPRREIVEMAIRALKAVYHRGAVDAATQHDAHLARSGARAGPAAGQRPLALPYAPNGGPQPGAALLAAGRRAHIYLSISSS